MSSLDVTRASVQTPDARKIARRRSLGVLVAASVIAGCVAPAAKVCQKKVRLSGASIAPVTFWRRSVPVQA